MVTHLDIVESKLGFSKFTLNYLAQTLKVSYGLARKYALDWVEGGRPPIFQNVLNKTGEW